MNAELEKIFKARLDKFRELLAQKNLDAFVLFVFEALTRRTVIIYRAFGAAAQQLL